MFASQSLTVSSYIVAGFQLLVNLLLITFLGVSADRENMTINTESCNMTITTINDNNGTCDPRDVPLNLSCLTTVQDCTNLTLTGSITDRENSIQHFHSVLQKFDCWCPDARAKERNRNEHRGIHSPQSYKYSHLTDCQHCLVMYL